MLAFLITWEFNALSTPTSVKEDPDFASVALADFITTKRKYKKKEPGNKAF